MPDPGHGYCTDDVARAAIVDVLQARVLGWRVVGPTLRRSLTFLAAAFVDQTGRFRNFRDDDGNWLEREGSPDAHARALHALALVRATSRPGSAVHIESGRLFERALPAALEFAEPRPWARTILACVVEQSRSEASPQAAVTLAALAQRLSHAFEGTDETWPWPETTVTYENGLLCQALIEAGDCLGDRQLADRGIAALRWLLDGQAADGGYLVLVGNRGWWPRGSRPARYDQQPIDAAALVEACAAAWRSTAEPLWLAEMERCYAWFVGWNSTGIAVADAAHGSCGDGLSAVGVSANQGAESTLAWLTATEVVRVARAAVGAGPDGA